MGSGISKGVCCFGGGGGSWKDVMDQKSLEAVKLEAKNDELLALLPARLCSHKSGRISSNVSIYCQRGQKGINQDSMLAWEGFASTQDTTFCGVFDGHGPNGHAVSIRVRDSFPSMLSSFWHDAQSNIVINEAQRGLPNADDEDIDLSLQNDRYGAMTGNTLKEQCCAQGQSLFEALKTSYHQAFQEMDNHLKTHPLINCFHSGTTAVTIVKQGNHLVIANVGDSRAVIGTCGTNNSVVALQLTIDLKPDLPQEEERIRRCNGRVFAFEDEPEVKRIWLPHRDFPGLAMARALGDFCLKDYGLISVPEVTCKHLTNRDLFVVLATDGVWDALSNQEVVSIVATCPTRATAAKTVVDSATRAWRRKYPCSQMDDCAVVCLYLDA